jgi:hypothetical protein
VHNARRLATSAPPEVTALLRASQNRAQFFALSAQIMRRILIDQARGQPIQDHTNGNRIALTVL